MGPPTQARRLLGAGVGALAAASFLVLPGAGTAGAATHYVVSPKTPMVAVGRTPAIPYGDRALGASSTTARQSGIVVLKPRSEKALTAFISQVTTKGSSSYHAYLTRGQFADRFGPTKATVRAVESELRSEGLHISSVSPDRLLVRFSASTGAVEHAFRTGIESYRLTDGALGQATTSAPRIPQPIARVVSSVVGLTDLIKEQPADITPSKKAEKNFPKAVEPKFAHPVGSPTPCTLAQQDAESSGGLTDDAIANSYGAFGLYAHGDFGSGQHIAVYELQPFLTSDIDTFDTCYFGSTEANTMTTSLLHVIPVDGGELQPGPGSENDEADLDIEDVSALAPQANIDVYEAPNTTSGGIDEYSQIIDSDTDQVVTASWAVCEQLAQTAEPGLQEAENLLFQQAAAQGQSVLSAAGDTGDDECNESRLVIPPSGQNLLSELDPGSQPYALSVGGTSITNATQPPAEQVWDDGASWGGGGGGISESWQMPSWQAPVTNTTANQTDVSNAESFESSTASQSAPFTTPTFCDGTLGLSSGTPCREVPDVSAQADEFTGAVTIFGVSLGYGNPNGWTTIGGTSSASPIWAALLALVNASSACSSDTIAFPGEGAVQDVGFVNPILYGIGANAPADTASFNDITAGNNDIYGLDNGAVFPAHTGYDMASGLGSPQLTTSTGGNGLAFYMCDYDGQLNPPTVSALAPSFGSTAGGQTITVTGSGFGGASTPNVAEVTVDGSPATSFSVQNNTTLDVTLPNADTLTPPASENPSLDGAGPASIVVTNDIGQSNVPDAGSTFEYVDETTGGTPEDVPSVSSIGPYGGSETTPTPVTIFGSDFTGATSVSFGGVSLSSGDFTIDSPYEITVTPPAYSAGSTTCAPLPTTGVYAGENATNDMCQAQVVVTNANGSSATSTILPPYEGALSFDSMDALEVPSGYEGVPAPTEFDYIPNPTVTSTSTGTIGDLPSNAADLASEFGGATTNTVVLHGTGMNDLTLNYATFGESSANLDENAIAYPVAATGTTLTLEVPGIGGPSVDPVAEPVGFASIAGQSPDSSGGSVVYAGIPVVTSVTNNATGNDGVPQTTSCGSPTPVEGCGTPITIDGEGFNQTVAPLAFVDNFTGTSVGTQYTYTIASDTEIDTQAVTQNPDVVDVEDCSNTGCGFNPPEDFLYVYPPGNPQITSLSASSGPAQGGNTVVIDGANLGCAVSVSFGSVVTYQVTNTEALLDCGATNQIEVQAPPGAAGSPVPVTVSTVESVLAADGQPSNSLTYTYTDSPPSAVQGVHASAGAGTASVSWTAPASDGGSTITGYTVVAKSPGRASVSTSVAPSTTKVRFSDLQAGAPWRFTVTASSKRGTGLAATSDAVTPTLGDDGYFVVTSDGGVVGTGDVTAVGGIGGTGLHAAGIAATPDGLGYWVAATNGTVQSFGNAPSLGDKSTKDVVGIASSPTGTGYWLVTSSGKVYGFGVRRYSGSAPGTTVGIASTPDGKGYWLVSSKGAVTAFGDAHSYGSANSSDVVGIAPTVDGKGYWIVTSGGAVIVKGDAKVESGPKPSTPVAGIATAPVGTGYWLVGTNGKVSAYGSAKTAGNAPSGAGITA